MRRWVPKFRVSDTMICMDDGEAEGPLITIEWFGWLIELSIARRTGTIA